MCFGLNLQISTKIVINSTKYFCYAFFSELIRNRTLDFLSKTLPVLKADDTLPKVTQISDDPVNVIDNNG